MTRTFRYPLRPTRQQAREMASWLEVCADVYNAALQERRDAWRVSRRSVGRIEQQRELTEVRAADADIAMVPVEATRSALRRVELAFQAFYRRSKGSGAPGYPRFRSRSRYASFGFPLVSIAGNRIRVPKLGMVRFHRYRQLEGRPLSSLITRESTGKWYVSIACDVGNAPAKIPVRSAIGVDLGLTSFATLSDGSEVANPRWARAGAARLRRHQQALSRRVRGSKSRERARITVARVYAHVANQRLDFARKLACDLFKRFDLVAHEDLEVRGMARTSFAKSINDAGWDVFLRALHCKAERAGKHAVAVDPRGTTQRCSGCGETVPKGIADRVHACRCGLTLGRDHNAALNVLRLGGSRVEVEKSSAVETERPKLANHPKGRQ